MRIRSDIPSRYQDFIARCRRYDRNAALIGLSHLLRDWEGSAHDEHGNLRPVQAWNVAGTASVLLGRGTLGGAIPTYLDLITLTHMFANLEHPVDFDDPGARLKLLARFIYQQWPFARHSGPDWARPTALFSETSFPNGYSPEVMQPGWEHDLLGTDVSLFVSAGFVVWAAAKAGSYYPFPWTDELRELPAMFGGQDVFNAIVESNYVTSLDAFKEARLAAVRSTAQTDGERYKREPFAYNPLLATPLVTGIATDWAVPPCLPAIALKTSVPGIIYSGLARWGEAFTRDVGHLFQAYVGRQLMSRDHWTVLPEMAYGPTRDRRDSIDWFVITDDYVLLIECKGALPTAAIREGADAFIDAHLNKLSKSIRQLNATRQAILDGATGLESVPSDRPMIGLTVTLGNFDIANDPEMRPALPQADFPVAIVGVDFLEWLATLSPDEVREALAKAEAGTVGGAFEPRGVMTTLFLGGNRLLEDAYERIPIIARLGHLAEADTGSDEGSQPVERGS